MTDYDLIVGMDEGVAEEDLLATAQAILRSGLHRSAGRYGRLVEIALDEYGPEAVFMDGELFA